MSEPMDEQRLAEIEGQHYDKWSACRWDGEEWPCQTSLLVAEVRRLQKALEMLLAATGAL